LPRTAGEPAPANAQLVATQKRKKWRSEKTISHQRRSIKIASMAKRLLTAHGGFDEAVVASRKKLATRRRISRQAEEPCSTLLRFNERLHTRTRRCIASIIMIIK
jgi:hypothetical protein